MKRNALLLIMVIAACTLRAQIPNAGFESWTTAGSYEIPSGLWITPNGYVTGTFYPVTKSTDHYPTNVGNYSIRFENNTSVAGPGGCGIAMTNTVFGPGVPMFAVSGHPASFSGYYKFAPQNGDTMKLAAGLFKNGVVVAAAIFTSTASTAGSWMSFNISFGSYATADSGYIHLSSYNAEGPTARPMGNSVLYIDNLSFSSSTSVPETTASEPSFSMYPNPAGSRITLSLQHMTEGASCEVYNLAGMLVRTLMLTQQENEIETGDLPDGVYVYVVRDGSFTGRQKLVIAR